MIAAAEPIHRGHIDRIPPHVLERSVVAAIATDLGVTMKFAAYDLQWLALVIDFVIAATGDLGSFFHRGVGCFLGRLWRFPGRNQGHHDFLGGELKAADKNVIVEKVSRCFQRIIAATSGGQMTIHPVIAGMRHQQTAIRMTGHGGRVVEQVVGMRQDDRADPFFPIVISRVVNPDRTQRGMEGSFPRAGE